MSKHTPGPWELKLHHLSEQEVAQAKKLGMEVPRLLSNEGQCPVMAGTGDDRCRIAQVDAHAEWKRGQGWHAECETRDANARLIAAAPELLEALRGAVHVMNLVETDGTDFTAMAKKAAASAIAKAMGVS